jgi:pantoate--beta-alanine ligase
VTIRRETTIAGLRAGVAAARADGARIGLVPTMGALHEGHLALVGRAAALADTVVVSIFVNPTQFDRADDLDAYPRDLDGDERALAALGDAAPALVFSPPVEEMYPTPPRTRVHVDGLTDRLCGTSRPGHFDGVATVVTKLLSIVTPDVAVFGRKDRQQLAVVQRLVDDLDLPVEIVGVPTVREPDGLAASSRNRLLDADARRTAGRLARALVAGVGRARADRDAGRSPDVDAVLAAAAGVLDDDRLELDYLEVVDPETFHPPEREVERMVLAVAAYVGGVRLIDNVEIGYRDDEDALLAAVADVAAQTDDAAPRNEVGDGPRSTAGSSDDEQDR